MCPIGGNFTMDASDAARAVEFVAPELAIPIHYNTFPVIQADPQEFVNKVAHSGHRAQIMVSGDTLLFD
jgi:L-ascorbate metabolism protein UlaG (beta-lactamase superfamily)